MNTNVEAYKFSVAPWSAVRSAAFSDVVDRYVDVDGPDVLVLFGPFESDEVNTVSAVCDFCQRPFFMTDDDFVAGAEASAFPDSLVYLACQPCNDIINAGVSEHFCRRHLDAHDADLIDLTDVQAYLDDIIDDVDDMIPANPARRQLAYAAVGAARQALTALAILLSEERGDPATGDDR